MSWIFFIILHLYYFAPSVFVDGAFEQGQEGEYLARFDEIMEGSYSQVDDLRDENLNRPPQDLIDECKNGEIVNPTNEIVVTTPDGSNVISAFSVQSQCGPSTICIVPDGITLQMNGNLNVGALILRGNLEWTSVTQALGDQFLCGGYIVVEQNGSFEMNLNESKSGWVYIKNNGAEHPELQTRSFGTYKQRYSSENPTMSISGRESLVRTWSLLSEALNPGATRLKLMHDARDMGWRIGDRLAIAPTEPMAKGWGQVVFIKGIEEDGAITLNETIEHAYMAKFQASTSANFAALLSAEVVNLTRNIVITGDDFEHVPCVPDLPEAVQGEQSSVKGCRCSFRSKCTVGLHTMQKHGGVTKIQNTRVEKCGQRGIEGKYCMHFHKMGDCPDCVFRGNAIENSQQRGIIIHGTHNTNIESNVLYNVRGAYVYLEDGNEMWNTLAYNVAICPFPFLDQLYRGCTVPGTSNNQADTSLNQAAFYSNGASTNNFIGNRAANHFNGMFLDSGEMGRGEASGRVCESSSRLGRFEGNTFHGSGRFGTYALGKNYPQQTDQSIANNGFNFNMELCKAFDTTGQTHGLPGSFVNHVDYGNAFVGQYAAGDIQYNGHHSVENLNLIYWKETKNFQDGCSSHIMNGYYSDGDMLLPDQATFIIDNTVMNDVSLHANHHCNVGTTGFLCMPTYILHKVQWTKKERGKQWIKFQNLNFQGHAANQNHGGIFALSPPEAAAIKAGNTIQSSIFPDGYISLVSNKFNYLLGVPNNLCIESTTEYGDLYDNGILCRVELRALKVYTRELQSASAPYLRIEVWFQPNGKQDGSPDSSQLIGFHQIGGDNQSRKQGYSVPVIPGTNHSYRISLSGDDEQLPREWVIEFSDPIIGNRWSEEELILNVAGRECANNGLISSQHDRKFIWGGTDGFLDDNAWSLHGACVGTGPDRQPPNEELIDCNIGDNSVRASNIFSQNNFHEIISGIIEPTHCPEKCNFTCGPSSYCDCGSKSCNCKAGHVGLECEIDLCGNALCSDHGFCSTRYLGGDLPVIEKSCICEDDWRGEYCDKNPCVEMINDCGDGTCVALSENEATCERSQRPTPSPVNHTPPIQSPSRSPMSDENPIHSPIENKGSCSAHPKCRNLSGECCPTNDGVMLGCCSNGDSCSAFSKCSELNLKGNCCPTDDGQMLQCCFDPVMPSGPPSTFYPSKSPSNFPSESYLPSITPSEMPNKMPNDMPSDLYSELPSEQFSKLPSNVPSNMPSQILSKNPSKSPSEDPHGRPSSLPSFSLSISPSSLPSRNLSTNPVEMVSMIPTNSPEAECDDKPSSTRFDIGSKKRTKCDFVKSQPPARRRKLCRSDAMLRDGSSEIMKVKLLCPRTCQICPHQCKDSRKKFDVGNQVNKRCKFLHNKPLKMKERYCKSKYGKLQNGRSVAIKHLCERTCGEIGLGQCSSFLHG